MPELMDGRTRTAPRPSPGPVVPALVTAYIAVLGQDGNVIEVNDAWSRFLRQRALGASIQPVNTLRTAEPRASYVGGSYFDLCVQLCGEGEAVARAIVEGCRDVTDGRLDEFLLEHSLESPEATRWFIVRAVRLPGPGLASLVVSHEDVTPLRSIAEAAARDEKRFSALSEVAAALKGAGSLEVKFDRVAAALHAVASFDWLAIAVLEGHDRATVLEFEGSGGVTTVTRTAGAPLDECMWGLAVNRQSPIRASAPSPEALAAQFPQAGRLITRARLRSFAAAPLLMGGHISGALCVASRDAPGYSHSETETLGTAAALIAGAVAETRRTRAVFELAEAKDLELRLEAGNRELQAEREERTLFLSSVSHELKSPLTAIVAFADIMGRNRERTLSDKQAEQVRTIQRSAVRLNLMVTDLLNLTRIDAGNLSLRKVGFDACALVDEAAHAISPTLSRKKQKLVVHKAPAQISVVADRDRIGQVLTNLLDNASKYSEERKEIRLDASAEGEWLHLTIEDDGVGIPEAALQHIFRPFYRVDNEATRSVPGTGLGLAIVKRLAEMHGGSVEIESEQGRGTRVRVSLPVAVRG